MPYSPGTSQSGWSAEQWSAQLIEALMLQSAVLRAPVTRVLTNERVVHVPRVTVAPTASWVAELAQIPSDSGDADTLALTPRKVADTLLISSEQIADASVDVLNAVGAAMTRGVAQKIDEAFFSTSAETATVPAGVLSNTLPGEAAAMSIDAILDGIGAIQAVGGSPDTVFLAPADITALRKAKSNTGFYLLAPEGASLQAPGAERIGGCTLLPTVGLTAGHAVVADARFIEVAIRQDMSVEFSPDAGFGNDATVARITCRIDWGVGDPNAFYVVSPAA